MEVSEALDILRGKKPEENPGEPTESQTDSPEGVPMKIYDRHADIMTSVKGAIIGLVLMILLYNLLVHPIDRMLIKMAVMQNYTVSVKVGGASPQLVQVDGNVMYADGKYYETVGDKRYIYYQANGRWLKKLDTSYTGESNDDVAGLGNLLKKENYKRALLPWASMKYIGPSTGMYDVEMKVSGGNCYITGMVSKNGIQFSFVYIDIKKFGTTKVTLPEIE